jgi:hypothetical protein
MTWTKTGGVLILAACVAGCAGWQIGNRSLYPAHIRTVYVPVFDSGSFRRGLGEQLTEAVCKEIELKTPYKVTGNPNADSVLSGRIARDRKRVLIRSNASEPREYEVNLYVDVTWIDNRGNPIRDARSIALPPDVVNLVGVGNVIPQTGESTVVGQQEAIRQVAEQIVSLMEAPW